MPSLLPPHQIDSFLAALGEANRAYADARPGPRPDRQPVHTVYGGAQLFKADLAEKMGRVALRVMDTYAEDAHTFAEAVGLPDPAGWLAREVYRRVRDKLQREPVEDFRIDFEDGFGVRPLKEERAEAARTASEVARGMREGSLPPFLGIRIKPLNPEYAPRSLGTLNRFFGALLEETGGALPDPFFVTLPKITRREQVRIASEALALIEQEAGLPAGKIGLELMIETAESIIGSDGRSPLPDWVAAASGRCTAAHFGVYDYTAGMDVTAAYQTMGHPACDFARHAMQVALAGTGVWLSDGATNILPVAPHKGDSEEEARLNRAAVHHAWRLGFQDNMHSLRNAYYQGWDLHPAQLPTRYAAVYAFFLEGLEAAATRLGAFVEKAAQASLVGDVFDDAATGQGLLNFFLRAINCGAITEEESSQTGLDLEEIRLRSFSRILEHRAARTAT